MLRTLIVEDEAAARRLISRYVADTPGLAPIATVGDALGALRILREQTVDLLLLDIHLPKLTGLDLLRTLRHPPAVVLTTAYPQHALESYELDVVDYLLKPFSFARFVRAVDKVRAQRSPILSSAPASAPTVTTPAPDHFFVRSDKVVHRIDLADLVYCKAEGDFVRLVLRNGQLLAGRTLAEVAAELAERGVVQVHRSYLIRLGALQKLAGNRVYTERGEVPVGRAYREGLLAQLHA